jgi:hypothetical protein
MYNYDNNNPEYREAYRQAARRVQAKLGFYWHFASYLVINGLLIAVYLLTTIAVGGLYYPWFVWVMASWGVGLLFHFMGVYVFPGSNSSFSRQKMIEEELRKMGANVPSQTGYNNPPPIGSDPSWPNQK